MSHLAVDDAFALGVVLVRAALQEQRAEDVVLVGGGIQPVLAQLVGGGEQMTFELGK